MNLNRYLCLIVGAFVSVATVTANADPFTKVTNSPVVTDGNSNGGAWGDYDNDGDLDLFVGRGVNDVNQTSSLFINQGNGAFTKFIGAPPVTESGHNEGGAWGDIDNDGDIDLLVANYYRARFLYRNNGNGQ